MAFAPMAPAAAATQHLRTNARVAGQPTESRTMDRLNMAWVASGEPGRAAARSHAWLRRWPGIAALAGLLALLMAYQAVVRGSVLSGDSRRAAVAAQAQAMSQCATLAGRVAREACRLPLQGPGTAGAMPAAPP
jgi:hypothetical protein